MASTCPMSSNRPSPASRKASTNPARTCRQASSTGAVLPLEVPAGVRALPPEDHVFECAATADAREVRRVEFHPAAEAIGRLLASRGRTDPAPSLAMPRSGSGARPRVRSRSPAAARAVRLARSTPANASSRVTLGARPAPGSTAALSVPGYFDGCEGFAVPASSNGVGLARCPRSSDTLPSGATRSR